MAGGEIEDSLAKRDSARFKRFTIIAGVLAIAFFIAFLVTLIVFLVDKNKVNTEEFQMGNSSRA